jgi:hypothetical protein
MMQLRSGKPIRHPEDFSTFTSKEEYLPVKLAIMPAPFPLTYSSVYLTEAKTIV